MGVGLSGAIYLSDLRQRYEDLRMDTHIKNTVKVFYDHKKTEGVKTPEKCLHVIKQSTNNAFWKYKQFFFPQRDVDILGDISKMLIVQREIFNIP